jgi:hypothetical protein
MLIVACNESVPVDPGTLPGGGSGGSGSSGGGASDTTAFADEGLVGTWINFRTPANDQDVRGITTTWSFGADGACGRIIATESFSSGVSTLTRAGTCVVTNTEIFARFIGETTAIQLRWGLINPSTLTLDSLTFTLAP